MPNFEEAIGVRRLGLLGQSLPAKQDKQKDELVRETSNILFGTNKAQTSEFEHANLLLGSLEQRITDGIVSVTLNHSPLSIVLRQLVMVLQNQAKTIELNNTQSLSMVQV